MNDEDKELIVPMVALIFSAMRKVMPIGASTKNLLKMAHCDAKAILSLCASHIRSESTAIAAAMFYGSFLRDGIDGSDRDDAISKSVSSALELDGME